MPRLTIHRGSMSFAVDFLSPERLSVLLARSGMPLAQPCGGRGVCGKCAVLLTGDASAPNHAEQRCGVRLACQAVIRGDCDVILPEKRPMAQIEAGSGEALVPVQPMPGRYGAAIDIGTTTLVLRLYDLHTGRCLAHAAMLNPQTSAAADVIGRIGAAMGGQLEALSASVRSALRTLLGSACAQGGVDAAEVTLLTVTGNTTMLYLLTGRSPERLSCAPFEADCLFGEECVLLDRRVYLPPCLHAFVGADTACALLASGMLERAETALLCDAGTNGEIALWHRGQLYVASAAAGPAFEGAGISCGCGSVPGAIDRVWTEAGEVRIHTIGEEAPVGLCGSGLLDAAATLAQLEIIDETGAMEEDCPLAPGVVLTRQDVRALQLAKAALAAGMDSLLHAAGCRQEEVTALYLAGGFGSHLNADSAARIGMIPVALADKVRVIGNAALDGAAMLLADTSLRERTAAFCRQAQHVRLDGNAYFSQRFVDAMMFGE